MNLYVESNFVLELAYLQDDHESCASLLALAAQGRIGLILPAFCIGEPYENLVRRRRGRRELAEALSRELQQLARSQPYVSSRNEFARLASLLLASGEEEKRRLDETLLVLLDAAEVIPLDGAILRAALELEKSRDLSPQDAIVYASITRHLSNSTGAASCFVNKNSRDFDSPDIVDDLSKNNCKLLFRFGDALGYIRNYLAHQ